MYRWVLWAMLLSIGGGAVLVPLMSLGTKPDPSARARQLGSAGLLDDDPEVRSWSIFFLSMKPGSLNRMEAQHAAEFELRGLASDSPLTERLAVDFCWSHPGRMERALVHAILQASEGALQLRINHVVGQSLIAINDSYADAITFDGPGVCTLDIPEMMGVYGVRAD
jgi:hypothetical protein